MKNRFIPRSAAALAVGCLALQGHSQAQVPVPSSPATTLREVRVDGNAENETATSPVVGYRAKNAQTATKTDTPLSETPQSVTVVTRDQIVDQGATNLQDALLYAAGVRSDAYGLDSRTDSVLIRGSEPTLYLDGLQMYSSGYYTSTARPDLYTLERLEVLRGPAGMLFGAGTAAGVINMVSKRPQQETSREVGVQYGSWSRKQLQADLTGPLTADGDWSYRLVALKRDADTQVDHVPDDRSLVMPSLTWRPNAATSLTLQALWQKDKTGSTSQFFPWEGTILPNVNGQLSTSRFIGEPGDGYDTERKTFGWLFEHKFNDQWTFRQNLRLSRTFNDSHYHYADSFSQPGGWALDPDGQRLLGRYYSKSLTWTRMAGIDNHVEGHFDTGAVRHTLLLGAEYSHQRQDKTEGYSFSTIDAYAPVYGVNVDDPALSSQPRTTQRNAGVYVQDQMKLNDWIFVAGLRRDRSTTGTVGSESETTSATSKRFGVMYQLPSGWAPYLSYTESFTPQTGYDLSGNLFKPLRGEQTEAGVKYQPLGSATSFTASVFSLKEKNRTVSDTTNPNYGRQVDTTKNEGLELELKTTLARDLDLIANYTRINVDHKLTDEPRNQASVWGKYRFAVAGLTGFSAGMGVRYMGAYRDVEGTSTGPNMPSVALLDLMLAYETDQWRYALNINNATDKVYFSTCLARGDCWYGARRNIVASATYRF
ncbi:TonB-dependent siderophore receptor [Variovorax ginsengisoli]|uniref:Iron complex outermembrane receptor protein n=1 Tax=Variovorax ginsengisoli TaxID=363844 RepID=A0ABT9S2A9_9BURK|nr:TonB-dependent siderophore receptor [Variovorax ginsengisoli]MDP9898480.1 iron complex outermembrane receptor protein [Variovorax ginsengisoli]